MKRGPLSSGPDSHTVSARPRFSTASKIRTPRFRNTLKPSWPCSSSLAKLTFCDVELPPCRPAQHSPRPATPH